jgi:hypothetical protein
MKSVWQETIAIALEAFVVLWPGASTAQPGSLDDLYTTRAIVTGSDERNRPLGFSLCFEDVLVKVSGDPNVVRDARFETLAANAEQYISKFSYRDRFEGKPDECLGHVCFTPKSGHRNSLAGCLLCANSGHWSSKDARSGKQRFEPRILANEMKISCYRGQRS